MLSNPVLFVDGRIARVVANKGGLVCKLRLKGTTLCFVSCHLQVLSCMKFPFSVILFSVYLKLTFAAFSGNYIYIYYITAAVSLSTLVYF